MRSCPFLYTLHPRESSEGQVSLAQVPHVGPSRSEQGERNSLKTETTPCIHTFRQTDIQTDIQTDTHTDTQTDHTPHITHHTALYYITLHFTTLHCTAHMHAKLS